MPKQGLLLFFLSLSFVAFFSILIFQPGRYMVSKLNSATSEPIAPTMLPLQRVAHAGSGWNKYTYTNSIEALNSGYQKGFRIFEIDLALIQEKRVVCLHDFEAFQGKTPDMMAFFRWRAELPFTPCTLKELKQWFEKHDDAILMTDVKNEEALVLSQVLTAFSKLKSRLIVQIYSMDTYPMLVKQGVQNIVWTLYRLPAQQRRQDKILKAIDKKPLMAITMPIADAQNGLAQQLQKQGVSVLVHTVNSCQQAQALFAQGVDEIYTDWLPPAACQLEEPLQNAG